MTRRLATKLPVRARWSEAVAERPWTVGIDKDATTRLDEVKDWLALHNDAVTAVVFLTFGVDLIAKGLPPLT